MKWRCRKPLQMWIILQWISMDFCRGNVEQLGICTGCSLLGQVWIPATSFLFPHRLWGDTVGVSQNEGCQQTIEELGGPTNFWDILSSKPFWLITFHHGFTLCELSPKPWLFGIVGDCRGIYTIYLSAGCLLIHCRTPFFYGPAVVEGGLLFFRNKYPTTNKYLSIVNFVASNENCSNTILNRCSLPSFHYPVPRWSFLRLSSLPPGRAGRWSLRPFLP